MSKENNTLPKEIYRDYTDVDTIIYGKYRFQYCPHHPKANIWGFVQQHRLFAERRLGRYLLETEIVHHRNQDKLDNRLENLQVVTRSEHQAIHMKLRRLSSHPGMTADAVEEMLKSHGIKQTAAHFGITVQTLRVHFPDLTKPYVRRSPTKIDDKAAIEKVLLYAPDDRYGLREIVQATGISARTIKRICERNGIKFVRKSKRGELHTTYDTRTAQELIDANPQLSTKIVESALNPSISRRSFYKQYPQTNYVYLQKILDYYNLKWIYSRNHTTTSRK